MKIVELEQTCSACPSQWEGRLDDGREIYIRYRHGALRYDIDSETAFRMAYGGMYDGSMDLDEMLSLTKLEIDPDLSGNMKRGEEELRKMTEERWSQLMGEWEKAGKPDGDVWTWNLHKMGIKTMSVDGKVKESQSFGIVV